MTSARARGPLLRLMAALALPGLAMACGPGDAGGLAVSARWTLRAADGTCPDDIAPHSPGVPPPGVSDVRLTVSGGGLPEPITVKFPAIAERIAVDDLPGGRLYDLDIEAIAGLQTTWAGGATGVRVQAGRTTRVGVLLTRVGGLTCTGTTLQSPRFHHTATRLPDGRVLLVGGFTTVGASCGAGCVELPATADAELYIPSSGEFRPAGTMQHARALHTAVALADGRVLVVGGAGTGADYRDLAPFSEFYLDAQDPALTTYEIWDSSSGDGGGFGGAKPVTPGRLRASSVLLADNRALIVGGLDLSRPGTSRADAVLFDPGPLGGGAFVGSPLSLAATDGRVAPTVNALADGRALVWGGARSGPFAETFAPEDAGATDRFAAFRENDSRGMHSLLHASALLADEWVLIVGGVAPDGTGYAEPDRLSARLVKLDEPIPILDRTNGAPLLVAGRFGHAAASLLDGSALIAGGYGALDGEPMDTLEVWRSGEPDFRGGETLSEPRAHLTATLLADGTVLLTGGRRNAVGVSRMAEIYRAD